MRNIYSARIMWVVTALLMLITTGAMAGDHITCSASNCVQTGSNTMSIDLYLVNDGTTTLALNSVTYGLDVNTSILNGGSVTWTFASGTSDLPSTISSTFSMLVNNSIPQLKLTSSPGVINSGNAPSLPSNVPLRVGTFNITNTHNWAAGTTNFTLNAVTAGGQANTGANVYADGNPTSTSFNTATYRAVSVTCSICLNCCVATTSTTNVTNCDSYTWNGTPYTTSGSYSYYLHNGNSCGSDSTAYLNLVINNSSTSTNYATACDSYAWNGVTYTTGGTYTFNASPNAVGCDSTATLVLTINNSSTSSTSITACDTYTWAANGQTYTASGTYTYSTSNGSGCTLTETLILTINNSTTADVYATACDTYTWACNSQTYTTGGNYTCVGTNGAGCTLTTTLHLTINSSSTSSTSITNCDSYVWNGSTYTSSGTYTYLGTNGSGCPLTETLILTINYSTTASISVTACNSYTWACNSQTYTTSGTYTCVTPNGQGCNLTTTLNLTINHSSTSSNTVTVCGFNTSTTFSTPGTTMWTAPAGATTVLVQAWGGGGAGGGANGAGAVGGGGGGGGYASMPMAVTPGTSYSVVVGAGGTGVLGGTGNAGGQTRFTGDYGYLVYGSGGGAGGSVYAGKGYNGTGGGYGSSFSNGGFFYTGGLGVSGTVGTVSGGGGGGAGSTGNGGAANLGTGGTGGTGNGGNGGNGVALGSNGINGSLYGGGGSGAASSGAATTGGNGANGQIILTYVAPGVIQGSSPIAYTWNGGTYTTAGTYTYHTTNAAGCDSTATLALTFNSTTSSNSATACVSYAWNGSTFTTSGTDYYHTTNAAGCDSTAILHLTINQPTTSTNSATVCGYTTSTTFNTPGTATWTAPAGITTVTVQAWGGGGAGGGANGAGAVGGGGGGGGYGSVAIPVNAGTTYNLTVGAGGAGVAGATGNAGGQSLFTGASGDIVYGNGGGAGGSVYAGKGYNGAGGGYGASYPTGGFFYTGGLGVSGTVGTVSGGGGGGAGSGGNGGAANLGTGGTGGAGSGGNGGNGVALGNNGVAGSTYGGGGSGAASSGAATTGGNGANGQIILTYAAPNIVQGSSPIAYTWNGGTYTSSGTYSHVFSGGNSVGCDSTAILNLTFNSTSSTTTTSACLSYVWNGSTLTSSGTYTYHTSNAAGCDSLATLNLTIHFSTASSTFGTGCDSYVWNGSTYTSSGTYIDHFTNSVGCDSVASLYLTINNSTTSSLSATACDSYTWSANGTTYTASGTYTYATTNGAGCTLTETLYLTINNSSTSSSSATACDSYVWNGNTYTTSGTYTYATTNGSGCTLTETLYLTVNYSTTADEYATACDTYTWTDNGQTYTTGGDYTNVTTNEAGCNLTTTLHLTINYSTTADVYATACDTYTWAANGQTYTSGGNYTNVTTNGSGCPLTTTLHLTINSSTTSSLSITACDTYTWSANGQTYTTSGTYTYATTNEAGCTLTETLYLTVNYSTTADVYATACDTYTWAANGQTYTSGGNYTNVTTNGAGCNLTTTLHLTINYSGTASISETACNSYTWACTGQTYTTSGDYTCSTTNEAGCTLVTTLHLTIGSVATPVISVTTQPTTCATAQGVITVSSPTGAGYTYALDGSATYQSGVTFNANPGSHYVTAQNGGCFSAASGNVTVTAGPDPIPTATNTSPSPFCSGLKTNIVLGSNLTGTTYSFTTVVTGGMVSGALAGSTPTIAQTLKNIGSTPALVTYLITGKKGTCTNTTTATVTVNPVPSVTATPATDGVCSGSSAGIALTVGANPVAGTTYSWIASANTIGATNGSGTTISDVLTAPGVVKASATYTITPTANGCNGTAIKDVATVTPMPTVSVNATTENLCSGTKTNIVVTTSTGSGTVDHFTAVASDGNVKGFVASGSGAAIKETLTDSGTVPATVTYTIAPTYYGCGNATATVVVTVNPAIRGVAVTPGTETICDGSNTNLALTAGPVAGLTFSWTSAGAINISGNSNSSGYSINDVLYTTDLANASMKYTITPTANGCSGKVLTSTVTVTPRPVMTVTNSSPAPFCNGTKTAIALTANTSGAVYAYSASGDAGTGGYANATGNSIKQTLTNGGTAAGTVTYTITPSYKGCTGGTATASVTVNPVATGTASPSPQSICSGNSAGVSLSAGFAGTAFSWTASSVAGISGANNNSGTSINDVLINTTKPSLVEVYTITPSFNGCNGTKFLEDVTVLGSVAPVKPVISGTKTALCPNVNYVYSVTNLGAGNTLLWTLPANTTLISGTLTSTSITISYHVGLTKDTLKVTETNQCGGASTSGTLAVNNTGASCREADMTEVQVNTNSISKLVAYPNPAHDQVTIAFNRETEGSYELQMMDITGRIVMTRQNVAEQGSNFTVINLSGYRTGVYLLSLTTNDGAKQVVRIVVE